MPSLVFEGTGLLLRLKQKQITLGTWSNKISRSTIVKSGNATAHEELSEATSNHNKKVQPNKTRNKKKAEKPYYTTRAVRGDGLRSSKIGPSVIARATMMMEMMLLGMLLEMCRCLM